MKCPHVYIFIFNNSLTYLSIYNFMVSGAYGCDGDSQLQEMTSPRGYLAIVSLPTCLCDVTDDAMKQMQQK